MRLHASVLAVAVLALAACGEEQTAQTPDDTAPPTPIETTEAPPAPAPTDTAAAPADDAAAPVGSPSPPASTTTTTTVVASQGDASLQPYLGKQYAAGPVTLELRPDGTFVLNEIEGDRRVEGDYALEAGTITFSDPEGDVGPAQFPMRCRFEAAGNDFRLNDSGGTCQRFEGLTFTPAAG